MRPIALKGHERSITSLKYNREGDLLFSSAKSTAVVVWYSDNGERLGTYDGHTGAVWSVDVDHKTEKLLTASADQSVRQWDVETGRELNIYRHKVSVRLVGLARGERNFFTVTDAILSNKAAIQLYDNTAKPPKGVMEISMKSDAKVTSAMWGPGAQTIYATSEDGTLRIYDIRNGQELKHLNDHTKPVTQISQSKDGVFFATSSKDGSCRLYETKSLEHLKTYVTGRPINSCSMSPIKEEIIMGGGQDASAVTQTRVDKAQFKVRFFHRIFEEDIGGIGGHFGPINVVLFQPDGQGFASGGEDGYIRLHHFDPEYFTKFGVEQE